MNWRHRMNEATAEAWSGFQAVVNDGPPSVAQAFLGTLNRSGLDPTVHSAMQGELRWRLAEPEKVIERLLNAIERRPLGPYENLVLGLTLLSLQLSAEAFPHLIWAYLDGAEDPRLQEAITYAARTAQSSGRAHALIDAAREERPGDAFLLQLFAADGEPSMPLSAPLDLTVAATIQ